MGVVIGIVVLAAGTMVGAYHYFSRDLPSTARLELIEPSLKSQVFAEDSTLVGEFYLEDRALVPLTELPFTLPALPITWLALVWLGLIGSCVAYLLYFYLLDTAGPTRLAMVTYTFPVTGVLLGWLFLGEVINWELLLGTALVIASIVIVNRK